MLDMTTTDQNRRHYSNGIELLREWRSLGLTDVEIASLATALAMTGLNDGLCQESVDCDIRTALEKYYKEHPFEHVAPTAISTALIFENLCGDLPIFLGPNEGLGGLEAKLNKRHHKSDSQQSDSSDLW